MTKLDVCSVCGQEESEGSTLLHCSVCRASSYCSRECQRHDFASHKKACKEKGLRDLLQAIVDDDAAAVRRLVKTKYVLNGKVDYEVPMEEGDDDPDATATLEKWTALHQCVRQKRTDLLRILCASPGVKLEITDGDGDTPLFVAASNDFPLLRVLIEAGANVNAMSHDGWTALMMAVRDGNQDGVEALLAAGANLHLGRDMFGRGCIDFAASMSTGQMGTRMRRGETMEEAQARYRHILSILQRYA